jgi:hypothetical protein
MIEFSQHWRAYEELLARLHDFDRDGRLDSEEADTLRDQMDEHWKLMSPVEQQRMSGLSADLHTLGDHPPDLHLSEAQKREAFARLPDTFRSGDWEALLRLLRRTDGVLPRDRASYMRGRCWSALGDWLAGYWFYEAAAALDRQNANYRIMALESLFRAGRQAEASEQARAILRASQNHPRTVFGAAKVIFDSSAFSPAEAAQESYEFLIAPLRDALAGEARLPSSERLESLTIAAWVILAGSLQRLKRTEEAREAYDLAVARYTDSDELRTSRALFLLQIDRDSAERELQALVRGRTRFVYPYLILAHSALLKDRFEDCLEYCDEGLQRATRAEHKASFLEWAAIAMCELGAPDAAVRARFNTAIVLDPLNDRIRLNLEKFEQYAEKRAKPPLGDFQLPPVTTGDAIATMTDALRAA